jgi:hypothetical protein
LKNKILKRDLEKNDKFVIPKLTTTLENEIVINPLKELTQDDVEKLGKAIRDIFENVEIKTINVNQN